MRFLFRVHGHEPKREFPIAREVLGRNGDRKGHDRKGRDKTWMLKALDMSRDEIRGVCKALGRIGALDLRGRRGRVNWWGFGKCVATALLASLPYVPDDLVSCTEEPLSFTWDELSRHSSPHKDEAFQNEGLPPSLEATGRVPPLCGDFGKATKGDAKPESDSDQGARRALIAETLRLLGCKETLPWSLILPRQEPDPEAVERARTLCHKHGVDFDAVPDAPRNPQVEQGSV
jgi:hypothetical protein